jgi:glycerol-3-phosphate dehydrogenase
VESGSERCVSLEALSNAAVSLLSSDDFPILRVMAQSSTVTSLRPVSAGSRAAPLAQLGREAFDLLVIGGGVAGACAAWDASMRGLTVALIERADFGSGTSAHPLKVLHGGIRYLQHLDIPRLRESCAERTAFLRIAPHLTRPLPFALPTFGHGVRGKFPLRAAFQLLKLFTSGRNDGIENRAQHIPAPFVMSRREFLERFPAFDEAGLTGAGVFYDGQMLSPARIVYSIVRSAQDAGAIVLNYCAAERLLIRNQQVEGVAARDELSGATLDIRAKVVLNLTGPFAPTWHQRAQGGKPINVPLSRDMAIVVKRSLLSDMGLGIQTRYKDPDAWLSRGNRHLFMAPWRTHTLIGVNSKVYEGDPYKLAVTEAEIQGFVDEIREAAPGLGLTRSDVAVVNAGLLPFGENQPGQKDLSFGKRSVLIDHAAREGLSGLITGMTVRWTMGRLLGEKAIDLACEKLQTAARPSQTATTAVHGGDISDRDRLLRSIRAQAGPQLPEESIVRLADSFGTLSAEVMKLPDGVNLLCDGRTLIAEVRHAARNEMSVTLADIVLRRLDLGAGCEMSDKLLGECANVAGEELGWDAGRRRVEIERVKASYPFASPASQECHGAS